MAANNDKINWKILWLLSLAGLPMGALSVFGISGEKEPFLWLLLIIPCSLIIAKTQSAKLFVTGLLLGLLWGIINALIQAAFFEIYLENNPSLQQDFRDITFMHPRIFVIVTGPIIGLTAGMITGGLTLILKRLPIRIKSN